jgi:flagellar hook-basal body protein
MPVGQQVGLGVRPAGISKIFSQGQYVHTENELDLSIEGKGFFKVMSNGIEYYTRAGNFKIDKDGFCAPRLMATASSRNSASPPNRVSVTVDHQAAR